MKFKINYKKKGQLTRVRLDQYEEVAPFGQEGIREIENYYILELVKKSKYLYVIKNSYGTYKKNKNGNYLAGYRYIKFKTEDEANFYINNRIIAKTKQRYHVTKKE